MRIWLVCRTSEALDFVRNIVACSINFESKNQGYDLSLSVAIFKATLLHHNCDKMAIRRISLLAIYNLMIRSWELNKLNCKSVAFKFSLWTQMVAQRLNVQCSTSGQLFWLLNYYWATTDFFLDTERLLSHFYSSVTNGLVNSVIIETQVFFVFFLRIGYTYIHSERPLPTTHLFLLF